jgi:hypothetical protein
VHLTVEKMQYTSVLRRKIFESRSALYLPHEGCDLYRPPNIVRVVKSFQKCNISSQVVRSFKSIRLVARF